jgi:hypothetical protein
VVFAGGPSKRSAPTATNIRFGPLIDRCDVASELRDVEDWSPGDRSTPVNFLTN